MLKCNWKNLKQNRCPVCGNQMDRKEFDDYRCGKCGFFARKERGDQIIDDLDAREQWKHQVDEFIKGKGISPEKL